MEEGSFRCDANVSIRPNGQTELGTKTELKNMNSFKNVQKGLHYEIERHGEVLGSGGKIVQETRLFDPSTGATVPMRSKEQAHDYRYFPDPDLLPLRVEPELIEKMRGFLPELPREKKERFVRDFGIPEYDAGVLTSERYLAQYFEDTVAIFPNPKSVSNWMMTEFMRVLKGQDAGVVSAPVDPENLGQLLKMIEDGIISGKIGKTVFEEMWSSGRGADQIVKEKGLVQVSDVSELTDIIRTILDENPNQVARYLGGKNQLLAFFVGQTMKATRGKANPQLVNEILLVELEKLKK
jgi:aspartyl-tRNA(Asn)/glutamyl-tRNA(Gln) amidotransferase subunit B